MWRIPIPLIHCHCTNFSPVQNIKSSRRLFTAIFYNMYIRHERNLSKYNTILTHNYNTITKWISSSLRKIYFFLFKICAWAPLSVHTQLMTTRKIRNLPLTFPWDHNSDNLAIYEGRLGMTLLKKVLWKSHSNLWLISL